MNFALVDPGLKVEAEIAAILGDPEGGPVTAAQYERAAQFICCRRGVCDGPNTGHEHVA